MSQRNYGIDFLRILSMFMVMLLHILLNDGLINSETTNASFWTAWFIEIAAYGAVNCFALISGYVMYNSNPKISKFFNLWLQIAFYTVGFFVLFSIINQNFSFSGLIESFLPVSTKHYWYTSAYFGMFFLIPLLNSAVKNIEKKVIDKALIICFLAFCAGSSFIIFTTDPFLLGSGYSTLWLCLMYIAGAYIKKYDITEKVKKSTAIIGYAVMTVLTFLSKLVIHYLTQAVLNKPLFTDIFVSYISPTIVIASIALFIFCLKLSYSDIAKKIISFFAPASLGVYLIHCNSDIWSNVMNKIQLNLIERNPLVTFILVFATATAVYLVCSFIETGRIYLFKALRINKLCLALEAILQKVYDKLYSRFVKEDETASVQNSVVSQYITP